MKASGEMISNMEKEKRAGLMVLYTKDNIWLERSMEWEFIAGMTAPNMMESGMKTKSKALELTVGLMEGNTKANG
jgi:hypothetical protein